jgi:hypothetical protein
MNVIHYMNAVQSVKTLLGEPNIGGARALGFSCRRGIV